MESSTNRKNQHKRIVGLDILRSMAILFVLYNHSLIILRGNGFLFLKPISFDGVNLFFVLSGFLIGKIIYDAFNENFSFNSLINFWLFRAFKIIPSYLIILFILLILSKLTQLSTESFSMKYFIFSQNLSSFHPDFFKEAWSLSVEEWFYFAFPSFFYLLYLVTKKLKVSALICVFFFILFSLAARIFYFENNELMHSFSEFYRKVVIFRFDSIMFGVLFFLISLYFEKQWMKFKNYFFLLGLSLLLILEFRSQFSIQIYFPFLFLIESCAIAFTLPFFSQIKTLNQAFLNQVFSFISKLSYSLYLVNLSLVQLFIFPFSKKVLSSILDFSNSPILAFTLYFLLVILSALSLYFFIEKPFLKMRNNILAYKAGHLN